MRFRRLQTKRRCTELLSRLSRRISAILPALVTAAAFAGEASIEFARFEHQADGAWRVSVTLRHADSGWDHYADAWRVVAGDGSILGTRTLYHPHVNEQPFTRSLGGVKPPADAARVYIEAHDSVHGWNPERLAVDINADGGDRFEVER
jgi:hypothetical protein